MHEFALARAAVTALEEAARAHGAERILRVTVALGALGHVDADAFAAAFPIAAAGGAAAGARLVIERPEGAARCLGCGAEVAIRSHADLCPRCGAPHLVVTGGGGMTLKEMEVA